MQQVNLRELRSDSVLEIRGDGKAGGGLLLTFESLAGLFLREPGIHVQEWPFFSSARRGANIRSFMRVSYRPITAACEVTRPAMVLLVNEVAARTWDFAEGVSAGGTFVINTHRSPQACATHFRLSGRVITVPGDAIGRKYLKHAIGNASVYLAAARALEGAEHAAIVDAFIEGLRKRHLPDSILQRNRDALEATPEAIQEGLFDEARPGDHVRPAVSDSVDVPVGAQTALRLSQSNRTSDYAPSGFRLRFEDADVACTGCAHCINNCPEGIIRFKKDPERGLLVTGVDVTQFCKLCGECIAVCPENLFVQMPFEEQWEDEALQWVRPKS